MQLFTKYRLEITLLVLYASLFAIGYYWWWN
ncbi:hypothetical protein SAMN05444377_102103 [Flavobacterium fontis]|uniref:Uncharacterized protein n=1 Tax=Flavobacterium fontis TaxID=1124188 RepID=A0A1M4XM77_9FLAO|nr:hypothetical protein SAMN05444377_102103 [Flavobacterium fontis]